MLFICCKWVGFGNKQESCKKKKDALILSVLYKLAVLLSDSKTSILLIFFEQELYILNTYWSQNKVNRCIDEHSVLSM